MKKGLAVFMAVLMGASLIGCGNSSGNTAQDSKTPVQTDAPSGNAGAVETKGKEATAQNTEKTKIRVQSWQYALGSYKGYTEDADVAAAIAEEFNSTHEDIELEVSLMRQEDHFNALKVDFSAGSAPDVIGLTPGAVLEQFKTQLEPLAPHAAGVWGENWQDRFTEASLTTIKMSGDEIYALPSAMSAAGMMWYADEQMKAGGVDKAPTTWEELKTAADTLRASETIPLMFGGKDTWQNSDMFITLLGTINKDLTNKLFNGEESWDHPDVIKAFEYYQKLFTDNIVQDGALSTTMYNEGYSLWRTDDGTGIAPMIFNGSWELGCLSTINSYYDAYTARGIHISRFPSIEGKEAVILSAPDVAWSVNKSCENVEAAWEVVRWLTDEMQQSVVDGLGFFSVLKDSPQVTVELPDSFRECYDVVAKAISSDNSIGFREAFDAQLGIDLFNNLQLLATGGITPQEAAAAMNGR